jgi:hypothetical protein
VAVAVDNTGNRTTINNISGAPIEMTISAAPSTNSRIDAIVAYVDNPPEGVSTVADNPAACGMIVVKGNVAASPVGPNETMIRSAITADGASGVTAYYAVLATVKIASGTTDLTSANIFRGPSAGIGAQNIDFTTFNVKDIEVGTKTGSGDTRSVSFSRTHTTAPTVVVATCKGNVTVGVVTVTVDQISSTGFRMTPRYMLEGGKYGPATEDVSWAAFWT